MIEPGFSFSSSSLQNVQLVPKPDICSLHVQSDIKYRYAHTKVRSKVSNISPLAQEITFSMTLPENAFISSFSIEIDGKMYDAYVKEKEEAKQVYTAAVQLGKTAAHVAMSTRDTNSFTVTVNVEPRKIVTFHLTYEELLTRKLGLYKHVVTLDPGQVVQDLNVIVNIEESTDITTISVPELRDSNHQPFSFTDSSKNIATIERPTPHSAVIKYSPSPDEQKTMTLSGVKGQLIVQYDVDRTTLPSQILVNDGYFAHYFAPQELKPLPKHVTFALDISGSMRGRKIDQLKEGMEKILGDLNANDYFSLISFHSQIQVWRLIGDGQWSSACSQETDCKSLVVPVTTENILRGKLAIHRLCGNGSTNIHGAMTTAINVSQLGKKIQLPQVEDQISSPQLESIIIFLTDGQPTCGICDKNEIVNEVTRLNQMCKANIFALGFGNDVDFDFLKKLALRNSGFSRKIYEAADATLQLTDFYKEVSSPLLSNITFIYQPEQVEPNSLTRQNFITFFHGTELIVSGRIDPAVPQQEFTFRVTGTSSEGTREFQPRETRVVFFEKSKDRTGFMERLWAYLTIRQLLDEEKKFDNQMALDKKRQAIQLALKYSFVTPVTSLVVVRPDEVRFSAGLERSDVFTEECTRSRIHQSTPFLYQQQQAPRSMDLSSCESFSFGAPAPTSALFGSQQASRPSGTCSAMGFSFGAPAPTSALFGSQQASRPSGTCSTMGFSFGAPAPQSTSFGSSTGTFFGTNSTSLSFGSAVPNFSRPSRLKRKQSPISDSTSNSNECQPYSFGIPRTETSEIGAPAKGKFIFNLVANTTTCTICQGVIIGSDVSHLEKHMEKAHPDVLKRTDDCSPAKQRKLETEEVNKTIAIKMSEKSLVDACVDMVIVDKRPLSIFNDTGFRKIVDPISVGLNIPGFSLTSNLIQQKINDQCSEIEKIISKELCGVTVCLKLETITKYKCIFLAIHAHFIQNSKRKVRTLAIKELKSHHNKVYIANIITNTLKKFGMKPGDVLHITVNSGTHVPNFSKNAYTEEVVSVEDNIFAEEQEKKFLNIMLEACTDVGISNFLCPMYTMQLAIYDALNTEETILAKAREIAKKLKSSTILPSKLEISSKVPNRVDTTYAFLQSLCREMALNNAFTNPDLFLLDSEWDTIKSILSTLQYMKFRLKNFQENVCYFNDMYELWIVCQEALGKMDTVFAKKISANIKIRMAEVLKNEALLSTLFLDPKHKSVLDDNQKSAAVEKLTELWMRLSNSKEDKRKELKEKLNEYDSSAKVEKEKKMLEYWELEKEVQPELYKLALAVLTMPVLQDTEQRLYSNTSFLLSSEVMDVKENIALVRCFKIFSDP